MYTTIFRSKPSVSPRRRLYTKQYFAFQVEQVQEVVQRVAKMSRQKVCPFTEDDSPFLFHDAGGAVAIATSTPITAPATTRPKVILPALCSRYGSDAVDSVQQVGDKDDDIAAFIANDLDMQRLSNIHKWLWLAGLPRCGRPLHYHLSIERSIIVTEKADLHLVWLDSKLFLKPLPEYLMDHKIWEDILCSPASPNPNTARSLYEDARGFLLSYLWLITSKSDLRIAHSTGLLEAQITWERWVLFSKTVAQSINPEAPQDINARFRFGELRLSRLNLIYRFYSGSFSTFVRGYRYEYHQYSTFVERNFKWFATVIVYVTLVLTAMQVGLGTRQLRDNGAFNRACYGFTVFAIVSPLAVCAMLGAWMLVLVAFNGLHALRRRPEIEKQQQVKP